MPVFTAMTPESVHLGDKHIGALLAGDKLVYNRVMMWRKATPGTATVNIPEWASFMSILISGGGASGAFHPRSTGGGGGGGQLRLLTVDLVENPGSRASVTVGRGGSALHSVSPYGNNGDSTRFNGWNAESTWTADGGTTRVGANEEDGFGDGWNSLPEREARYLDRAPGSRYRPQTGGSKGQTFGGDGSMGGGGGKNLHFSTGRSGAGGDGFAIIHFFGIDPMTPRLEGGSVTPPPRPESEPPTQGGQDGGKFELGVTYQAGDIVTIGRGEYPAAAAEGTYRALVTHESSFYHYPWNDPRTWERIN